MLSQVPQSIGNQTGFDSPAIYSIIDDYEIQATGLPTIIVDFFAVIDYLTYVNSAGNKTYIESQIESAIQEANQIFVINGIPVFIDLVNVTYFIDQSTDQTILGDPNFTTSGELLDNFKTYRSTRADVIPSNMFWLITSRMGFSVAGLSSVSFGSTPNFTSFVLMQYMSIRVVIHFLGHNFSARHDGIDNSCDPDAYIMAVASPIATNFSPCSILTINTFLAKAFGFEEFNIPYINRWFSEKTIELGSTKDELSWNATDTFPERYTTYLNNIPIIVNQTWSNQTKETVDLTGLDLGNYNYSITYTDLFGNQNSAYSVVSVVDTTSPTIEFISQAIFNKDTSENSGEWKITDLKPNFADIYIDGSYFTNSNWVANAPFTLNIDSLSVGEHNLTVVAYDTSLNQITLDTIIYIYSHSMSQSDTSTFTTTETVVVTSEIVTTREVVQTLQKSEAGLSYPFLVMFSSLLFINLIVRRREQS